MLAGDEAGAELHRLGDLDGTHSSPERMEPRERVVEAGFGEIVVPASSSQSRADLDVCESTR